MIQRIIDRYWRSPESYARKIGVSIGSGCLISTRDFSSEPWLISIGDNVRIAKEVQFFTHGGIWSIRKMDKKYSGLEYFGKICIKNNVYIGHGAKIMPGVTIEENCIIGAGSIVTKSIPKGSVVAGNPARFVSTIGEFIDGILEFDTGLHGSTAETKKEKTRLMEDEDFMRKPFLKFKKS